MNNYNTHAEVRLRGTIRSQAFKDLFTAGDHARRWAVSIPSAAVRGRNSVLTYA
jgi:hypothetical protein